MDDDFGPDPDDDLENGYTDENGSFELSGDTKEVTTIDVHLKIYHDCNDILVRTKKKKNYNFFNVTKILFTVFCYI